METQPSVVGDMFFAWLECENLAQAMPFPFPVEDGGGGGGGGGAHLTADEWQARGLEAVLAVDGDLASSDRLTSSLIQGRDDKLLSTASKYFQYAGDDGLQQRALAEQALRRFALKFHRSAVGNVIDNNDDTNADTDTNTNTNIIDVNGSDNAGFEESKAAELLAFALLSGVQKDLVLDFCRQVVGPQSCDPERFETEVTERLTNAKTNTY